MKTDSIDILTLSADRLTLVHKLLLNSGKLSREEHFELLCLCCEQLEMIRDNMIEIAQIEIATREVSSKI